MKIYDEILPARASAGVLLIRLVVGLVFLSEGGRYAASSLWKKRAAPDVRSLVIAHSQPYLCLDPLVEFVRRSTAAHHVRGNPK